MKSRLLHFFLILFLSVCGFISLVLLEIFGHEVPEADFYIPLEAEWVVQIDPEKLAKDELYSMLFEAKDDPLLDQMKHIADGKLDKRRERGSLTIDFRHPVVLFGTHQDGTTGTGILFQVLDPAQFLKHIGNYLSPGQSAAVNGNTALILNMDSNYPDKKENRELASHYMKRARLTKLSGFQNDGFMTMSVPKNNFKEVNDLQLQSFYTGQTLEINGSFSTKNTIKTSTYSLKNKGLTINSCFVPSGFSDSLNKLLPIGTYHFPELNSVMLDYQGIIVNHSDNGILVMPQMNLILEAKSPVSADSLLASVPLDWRGNGQNILFPGTEYHIRQLDENTLFIGIDTNSILKKAPAAPFAISGSLSPLMNITGNSMVLRFMDVVPAYNASRLFISKTEKIDFSIKKKGAIYVVNGKIVFRKDASALHETFRLLIGTQLLN
jgi:hypothetical protein